VKTLMRRMGLSGPYEVPYSLWKGYAARRPNPSDQVSMGATAEAVVVIIEDVEARRLFVMKWAETHESVAVGPELYRLADNRCDRGGGFQARCDNREICDDCHDCPRFV
jgi:hypothetical protein